VVGETSVCDRETRRFNEEATTLGQDVGKVVHAEYEPDYPAVFAAARQALA